MTGFLIFATMAAAQPDIDFARWIIDNSQGRGGEVAAELELWVSPAGKVEGCEVARSAGSERAAASLCERTIGRRLVPARDPQGAVAYGVARTYVLSSKDVVRNLESTPPTEDAVLAADTDRGATTAERPEQVTVFVDAGGKIRECEATGQAGAGACNELLGTDRPVRYSGGDGAVSYIEKMRVRFSQLPAKS